MNNPIAAQIEALAKEYRPTMDKDVLHSWASDVQKVAPAIVAAIRQGEGWCSMDGAPFDRMVLVNDRRFNVCEAIQYRSTGWYTFGANGHFKCEPDAWREKPAGPSAPPPAPDERDDEVRRLKAALEWYGEQARLARLIHSEGDAGRHALSDDGGKRASAALSPAKGGE